VQDSGYRQRLIESASMARQAKIGTRAPGLSLWATDGSGTEPNQVSLDDYLDRWLVLLFYPRDFSMI